MAPTKTELQAMLNKRGIQLTLEQIDRALERGLLQGHLRQTADAGFQITSAGKSSLSDWRARKARGTIRA